MGDLSKHFSAHEFACKGENCCSGTAAIDCNLVIALEHLRRIVGQPLIVNSGFRCLTYNRDIGSKDTSQHPLGRAVDVRPPEGWTSEMLKNSANEVAALRLGGIGLYDTFIHVDVRLDGPARWDKGRDRP